MKRRSIILFLASLAAAAVGISFSPPSTAFILAAIAWGVVYLVLRFALWNPKSKHLSWLINILVLISGMRVSVTWIFPTVRAGSAPDWSLGFLFIGIVGIVVFGFRLLFLTTRAKRSI